MSATPEVRYWQHVESGHVNMARLGGGPDGVAERDPIWREVTVTPVSGERPVVTLTGRRSGKTQALIESLLTQAEARGLTVEVVHRNADADVAERIGAILREHQPTSGMQVASGVTCRCGYWTGEERPGVTRPVGYSGLMWHQAQMIATPPVTATSEEVDHYPMSAISVRGESAFCEWCGGEFESVDLYREHERVMVLARQAREATTREEADRG